MKMLYILQNGAVIRIKKTLEKSEVLTYILTNKLTSKKIIYPIEEQIIFFIADKKAYPYNSIPYMKIFWG